MKNVLLSGVALLSMLGFARADIIIGVGGPLTGPNAAFGIQMQKGAEAAAADINAAGGMNGEKIKIELGDDASDPKQGVSVANKFVGDGVKFVVGHFNSGVSIPASDVYSENGIFQISPASTNPKLTERGYWNVFRTCGRDDQQGKVAGDYLAGLKNAKVAFLDDKTPYGAGLAQEALKEFKAKGGKETMIDEINVGDKDFSALISKMKAAGVSVLYWGGMYTEIGLIARQSADQGYKLQLVSGDGVVSTEFATIGGPSIEGTVNTFGADPTKLPYGKEVVEKFRAANYEPEGYTLYSYAAVQLIVAAAKAVGVNDPQKVAEYLHKGTDISTVIGPIGYDAKGDRKVSDYVLYTWKKDKDGKITSVQND